MSTGRAPTLSASPQPVGLPTHESRLTRAAIEGAHDLLQQGELATPLVLSEVELGIGRPDVMLLAIDHQRLSLRMAAGLRLGSLTEAHVLQAASAADALSQAASVHLRGLVRRLDRRGWFDLPTRDSVVANSLLLEAKISSWQQGVRQLSRVRWASHQAALVMPEDAVGRVMPERLRLPEVGLISVDHAGRLTWRRPSPSAELPFYVDAWLGELALRRLGTG